ncbi:flagellin N-terminal helical domain-containing protein [Dongia sp. agr-C8]
MATNDIPLTSGIRGNLLLLQSTQSLLDRTQQRLSTGNKINSALDGPVAYFAAKGLNNRADDLSALKDSIGQSVSTIQTANTAATTIGNYLDQAQALINQAQQNLGSDANSINLRKSLATQFNTLLDQINKLAQGANYNGKNLVIGNGLRMDATSSTKSSTNAIPGVTGATVTNVMTTDDYVIAIKGDGKISANATDVANAEADRGISNVVVSGFQSKVSATFSSLSVKITGGVGQDKTITVTEGTVAFTQTFTQAQWKAANSTGQVLNFDHQFVSGTHINFDVDFEQIEAVPDTAGVGTSTIEKFADLGIGVTNFNGIGATVTRSASNLSGQQKLADGQNSWNFDTGTPRLTIDEKTILQSSQYNAIVGGAYGGAADAIAGTPTIPLAGISNDFTYTVTARADPANFDFVAGKFTAYSVTVTGPSGTSTIVVNGDGLYSINSIADGTPAGSVTIDFRTAGLARTTVASASDATQVQSTAIVLGGVLDVSNISVGAVSGFANDVATRMTINMKTDVSASTFVLDDGYGGKATYNGTLASSQVINFVISGGVNSGATLVLSLGSSVLQSNATGQIIMNAIGAYTAPRQVAFDVRAGQTGYTSTLSTAQVTNATDANNMTVQLDETNVAHIQVISKNLQTDGQGLAVDQAQNNWLDRADLEVASKMIQAAKTELQAQTSGLNNNLDIIQERQKFTDSFVNILAEGANKLVQADQNEESANMLQLQTRQQLGTITLSLANQAQQAILKLF